MEKTPLEKRIKFVYETMEIILKFTKLKLLVNPDNSISILDEDGKNIICSSDKFSSEELLIILKRNLEEFNTK